jgi:hypothetical protein
LPVKKLESMSPAEEKEFWWFWQDSMRLCYPKLAIFEPRLQSFIALARQADRYPL